MTGVTWDGLLAPHPMIKPSKLNETSRRACAVRQNSGPVSAAACSRGGPKSLQTEHYICFAWLGNTILRDEEQTSQITEIQQDTTRQFLLKLYKQHEKNEEHVHIYTHMWMYTTTSFSGHRTHPSVSFPTFYRSTYKKSEKSRWIFWITGLSWISL